MTKPYGLPKSEVTDPYDDRAKFSKRKERQLFKHKKKTARQRAKKETK